MKTLFKVLSSVVAALIIMLAANTTLNAKAPPAKEMNNAGIVCQLTNVSNVNFAGNYLPSEKEMYRQQSSNNNSDLTMNANLPIFDVQQWRNSSTFSFNFYNDATGIKSLQPRVVPTLKTELQGVVINSNLTVNMTAAAGINPYMPLKFPLQGVTSMNFVQNLPAVNKNDART